MLLSRRLALLPNIHSRLSNNHIKRITPNRIIPRSLITKPPLRRKRQRRQSIRICSNAINKRPRNRHPTHPIRNSNTPRIPPLNNQLRRLHLQKIILTKRIKRPQHLIPLLRLLLTPSHRSKLIIQQQAPELGCGFGAGGNGGDEVVVELVVEGAVVGEFEEFGGGVEGGGAGCEGGWVGGEVGAGAGVGAAGGGGDVAGAGVDGGFVDGVGEAFDAEVDDVGS